MIQVLFLDLRNAARSQMAEAWFNQFAAGWGQARSCGTMPADSIDPVAVQVMAEAGVDMRSHAPKWVGQQVLSQADLVVIMGPDVYPRAFAPNYVWDLLDPTGLGIAHYRVQRDAIRRRVQEFILEIQRPPSAVSRDDPQVRALLQQQMLMELVNSRGNSVRLLINTFHKQFRRRSSTCSNPL